MIEVEQILFELIVVFLFIFLNALFVAVEFSIFRVRNTEIEALIQKGDVKAKNLKEIKNNIDKYISAAQLGITVVNLILGWIGEGVFSKLFSPIISFLKLESHISKSLTVIIGVLILSYLAVTIGEIAPKSVAIRFPLKISMRLSGFMKGFYRVFRPFIWLLNVSANRILKMINIEPVTRDEIHHSEEEIRQIISEGRKAGIIDSTEHQLIEKIFDFNDKVARDIMVPRNKMVAIDIDDDRDKIIQTVIEEGYSRIPVYKETIDNIIGVIYSKDLISAAEHRDLIVLKDILRPAHFIPETKHIGELLKEFQKRHVHIGIVVNELGGVEGLVTLEDIIEEIVGEIEDEYDVESRSITRDKKGIYLINPEITIDEFNKMLNTDLPLNPDEYITLGGFLQYVTGHIPEIFERVDYKGLIFTVTKKSGNKLLQVRVQRLT